VASVSHCHTRSQHGTGSNVNEIRGKAVWKRASCVYKPSSGYITNCRMQFGLQNSQNFMTSSAMIVWLGMSVSPPLLYASTLSLAGEKLLCFQAARVVFLFLKEFYSFRDIWHISSSIITAIDRKTAPIYNTVNVLFHFPDDNALCTMNGNNLKSRLKSINNFCYQSLIKLPN